MTLGSEGDRSDVADGVALTDAQILALTLWGEGRGEPVEGRIAVGCVIRNRVQLSKWGDSYPRVCLAPWQFSCWRRQGGAVNYERVMEQARRFANGEESGDTILRECGWIAHGIIAGWLRDRVDGATHYYAPAAMTPKGKLPAWAIGQQPCAFVGGHVFYRGVK